MRTDKETIEFNIKMQEETIEGQKVNLSKMISDIEWLRKDILFEVKRLKGMKEERDIQILI